MIVLLASKRRARRLAPLLALAFVVAPAIGISQTADLATVRVGTAGQQGNAGVCSAADEGFFKKNGLQADITTIRHGSGAAVVAAVIGDRWMSATPI